MNPHDLVIRVNSSGLGSLSVAKLSHRITAARFIDAPIRFDSLIFTKLNFLGYCSFHCSKLVTWLSGTMYLLPGEVLIKCTKIKFQPIDWRESTTVGLQYKSFSLNK